MFFISSADFVFTTVQKEPNLLLNGVALTWHYDDACVFSSVFQILLVKPTEVRNVGRVNRPSRARSPLQLGVVIFPSQSRFGYCLYVGATCPKSGNERSRH